jgi:hypothetical protein
VKSVIGGIVAGLLVFFLLIAVFATSTGPVELLLWVVISVVVGVAVTKLLRLGEKPE